MKPQATSGYYIGDEYSGKHFHIARYCKLLWIGCVFAYHKLRMWECLSSTDIPKLLSVGKRIMAPYITHARY